MKPIKKVWLWLIFTVSLVYAQYQGTPRLSGIGIPYFEAGVYRGVSSNPDSIPVTVFMQILNDDLTFLSEDSGFVAKLEIQVSILKNEQIVQSKIFDKQFLETDFTNTNSRKINNNIPVKFYLSPGKYTFVIQFKDLQSGRRLKRAYEIELTDISQQTLVMSDVLFFSRVLGQDGKLIPAEEPNLLHNFTDESPNIYARFQLYVQDLSKPIVIKYQLITVENLVENEFTYRLKPPAHIFTQWIKIKKESLERSQYTVKFEVRQGKTVQTRSQYISFFWTDAPGTIRSLDQAIDQLRYVVPGDTLKKYRNASLDEKKVFFTRFWKMLDPDPSTAKNELMDEYYKRVNYANLHFSTAGRLGWKTDRGRIYIKFGPPDEIENYPSQMNSYPMQIWRYYNLRKEFVFIDRTGLGDYQLHPDYYTVEYTD
jgi:GWxTD domain-containing protein